MGLFDSLKKNLDTISKEVGKYADDLSKEIAQYNKEKANQPQQANYQQPAYQQPTPQPSADFVPEFEDPGYIPRSRVREQGAKFDDILARNFTDCTYRKDVPAAELQPGCHPACTPIQYLFYRDNRPVLAVVLVSRSTYRGRNVLGTKDICEALGIRYLRFYHELENKEDYVINRIRQNL